MTELPRAKIVGRRTSISIPVAFVLVWTTYLILLGTRADETYGAFHNDAFWPADSYLATAQDGIALPIFAHVMITLVGGLFLLVAIAGICRLIRRPNVASRIAPFVFVALFIYAFCLMRGIPRQVTTIDRDAHALHIREFDKFTLLPSGELTIEGRELAVLGAKVGTYGSRRDATNVVRIYASFADRSLVYLGMRTCTASKSECVHDADAVIAALAIDLGRTLGSPEANADDTIRAFPLRDAVTP